MPEDLPTADQEILIACVDLVGRSGARDMEIGYLHDNVPQAEAGWWAHAQYRGARIAVEDQPGPTQAAQALAEKILTGAKCACGRLVALHPDGAVAFDETTLADGTRWTIEQAAAAGQCRWRRVGSRWEMGCAGADHA
jgi:hypothetical protein